MTTRTNSLFFLLLFFGVFLPLDKGRNTAIFRPTDFFSAADPCRRLRKKKKKGVSTKKMIKTSTTSPPKASDTAKARCKHSRLYSCVEGSTTIIPLARGSGSPLRTNYSEGGGGGVTCRTGKLPVLHDTLIKSVEFCAGVVRSFFFSAR